MQEVDSHCTSASERVQLCDRRPALGGQVGVCVRRVREISVIVASPGPAALQPLLTNFSVTSSIRLLFFSLEEEKGAVFKHAEAGTKRGSLPPCFHHETRESPPVFWRFFPSMATYGSSASAILSRSHVLDCEARLRERQSCANAATKIHLRWTTTTIIFSVLLPLAFLRLRCELYFREND